MTLTYDDALEALIAAIVISQISAAIPVWGAMRVTPADAFRKTI
jgi:ABC-type lipoprotein release transport system permease subunit